MAEIVLSVLHYFFIASHIVMILFTLFGWLFRPLRKLHLITVMIILTSWFFLGLWYGFGYCFWTDWHWQVQRSLGQHDLPASFVKYMLDSVTGLDFDPAQVDFVTVCGLLAATVLSVYVNLEARRRNSNVGARKTRSWLKPFR